MDIDKLKTKLSVLPSNPGSYQMLNEDGQIIYIGKAKNLKKRVNSYFNHVQDPKTKLLVSDIADIKYIVTSSELEALILEINLIKQYNPKYNILLKDDKSYPYIQLSKENGPLVKVVRTTKVKKNTSLFGPFPNVGAAKKTVALLNRLYPLRKCDPLKKEVCLYYHLGECLAYCALNVPEDTVNQMMKEITSFLNGNSEEIVNKLKKDMQVASDNLNYEKAQDIKETIESIDITLSKQKIELASDNNFDLINFYRNNNYVSICIFFVRSGKVFSTHNDIVASFDEDGELLTEYIIKYYEKKSLLPKELITPDVIDDKLLAEYLGIKLRNPKRGRVKKLLDLAQENAEIILLERQEAVALKDERKRAALSELNSIFGKEIKRIEAFDNSHLFGSYYVSAMVVFDYFVPNKKAYRRYRIHLDRIDDLSAMKEALYRRFHRVAMGEDTAPDLLLIDGGEQQVKAALDTLGSLALKIDVIGLKKDEKHRSSSLIDANLNEINIKKNTGLFLYLSRIQEEVHRFAINYHRQLKSKGMLHSVLDSVPGIGAVRRAQLQKAFPSLKKMKEASQQELANIIGKETASVLYKHLKELE